MLNIHNATLSHKFLLYPILKSKYLRHFFRDLEIFYIRPGVGWAGILDNRSFLVGLVADRSSWFGISCFGAETPPPTNCGGRPIITQVGGCITSIFIGWSSVASFHDRCAWAAGQTGLGGKQASSSQAPPGHIQAHPSGHMGQASITRARNPGRSVSTILQHLTIIQLAMAGRVMSCVCVCVPVKPTRGNTT